MSRGSLNKAVIIGRIGRDPLLRYTPSGVPITSFSVATNPSAGKSGKLSVNTDWHRVVAWSKLAEICGQYLKKGALVCVEGQMKTRSWDDKKGVKHSVTEIVADSLKMLGHKSRPDQIEMEIPAKAAEPEPEIVVPF